MSSKKKKTLADKLFGSSHTNKENVSPNDVESSILYRALKEELKREQKLSSMLKEQVAQFNGGLSKETKSSNFDGNVELFQEPPLYGHPGNPQSSTKTQMHPSRDQ